MPPKATICPTCGQPNQEPSEDTLQRCWKCGHDFLLHPVGTGMKTVAGRVEEERYTIPRVTEEDLRDYSSEFRQMYDGWSAVLWKLAGEIRSSWKERDAAREESARREQLLRQAADRYRPADMVDVPELHPDHYEDEEWEFWRRAHLEVIGKTPHASLRTAGQELYAAVTAMFREQWHANETEETNAVYAAAVERVAEAQRAWREAVK